MGDATETAGGGSCCASVTGTVSASARKTKEEIAGVGRDIRHIWHQMALGRRIRSSCTVDNAKDYLPITKWLPKYRFVRCWIKRTF